MALFIIAPLEPKNGGNFPVAYAVHIAMPDGTRLDKYLETLELTPGPPGDAGGHYTPSIVDNKDGTFTVSFTPSIAGMPTPAPVVVTMPVAEAADITVDEALDENSTNPIQNKAVFAEISRIDETMEETVIPRILPEVAAGDNDKILQVVDGKWALVAPADSSVAAYLDSSIGDILGGEY